MIRLSAKYERAATAPVPTALLSFDADSVGGGLSAMTGSPMALDCRWYDRYSGDPLVGVAAWRAQRARLLWVAAADYGASHRWRLSWIKKSTMGRANADRIPPSVPPRHGQVGILSTTSRSAAKAAKASLTSTILARSSSSRCRCSRRMAASTRELIPAVRALFSVTRRLWTLHKGKTNADKANAIWKTDRTIMGIGFNRDGKSRSVMLSKKIQAKPVCAVRREKA